MPRMRQTITAIVSSTFLLLAVGCSNSGPKDGAQRAEGKLGLMPSAAPGFEQVYVANQAEVKLVTDRKVSYEPLDSFRDQNIAAAKKATEKKTVAKTDNGKKGKAVAKKSNGRIAGIKEGLKQKVGGLLGLGGAKPSGTDAKADKEESDADADEAEDEDSDMDEADADSEDEEGSDDEDADADEDSDEEGDADSEGDDDEDADADSDEEEDVDTGDDEDGR